MNSFPSPQRLLLIRRRYLGDIVLLDPLLRALRGAFPTLYLALLVDEGYEEVLARHPALDRIAALSKKGFFSPLRVGLDLRQACFDTCLNLSPGNRTDLVARIAGIPRRIGFRTEGERPHDGLTEPLVRPAAFFREHPILDLYAALLEPLSVARLPESDPDRPLRFPILHDAREEASERLARAFPCSCRPLVVIHPGARLPARRWPAAKFAEAAARLHAENRADLLLVCGPGEEPLLDEVNARLKEHGLSIPSLPALPLDLFAALCERASVYLGNDTGSMHVAAAAIPATGRIVALFGAQSTRLWAPAGTGHVLLQPALPCGGACVAPGACQPGDDYKMHCIARIGVDEVVEAVLASL